MREGFQNRVKPTYAIALVHQQHTPPVPAIDARRKPVVNRLLAAEPRPAAVVRHGHVHRGVPQLLLPNFGIVVSAGGSSRTADRAGVRRRGGIATLWRGGLRLRVIRQEDVDFADVEFADVTDFSPPLGAEIERSSVRAGRDLRMGGLCGWILVHQRSGGPSLTMRVKYKSIQKQVGGWMGSYRLRVCE